MKRRTSLVLVCALAVAAFVLGAGTISVCVAAPPEKAPCDQANPYDKLKCKHDSAAAQVEYMASNIFAEGTLLGSALTPGQRGQLASLKDKSARARGKNGNEDFKKLAKSQAKSNRNACYLVPLTPQDDETGDGICDFDQGDNSAKCAAIDLDDNGQLQECNPAKKNKGKGRDGLECDRICDAGAALTGDEAVEMEAEAKGMNDAYDALATDLYDLNSELEEVNSGSAPLWTLRSASTSTTCDDVPEITPGLELATGILRQVSVAARGVAGIAGAGCDQTAVALGFGGNGSIVCMVFETAASVLEIAYTTCDMILQDQSGALQSATFSCLQAMKGDQDQNFATLFQQHGDIVKNDDDNAAAILNKLEQVRAELVLLLSTPQGQREQFPAK